MKTYYFNRKRLSIYALFGFLAIVSSSCGSYQNSSYYDKDGVYGDSQTNNNNSQSNKYQEYFSDLNKDAEAFTGIDSYTSVTNDSIKKTENYNSNNAGWGNNPQSVTVNVYDNNWGYGYWNNWWYGNYWGWNNWYGPGWGWGIGWNNWYGPGWGFGWNNWYGNSWCGNYYNNYYNGGRRGSSYPYYSNGNRYSVRNGTRSSNYNVNGRNNPSVTPGTRNFNTRSSNYPFRSNTSSQPTRSNNSTQPTRGNNSYQPTRSNNNQSSPVRSYTPSSSNTRPSSTFGGGSYGGGSGGGRSSGGGGRR